MKNRAVNIKRTTTNSTLLKSSSNNNINECALLTLHDERTLTTSSLRLAWQSPNKQPLSWWTNSGYDSNINRLSSLPYTRTKEWKGRWDPQGWLRKKITLIDFGLFYEFTRVCVSSFIHYFFLQISIVKDRNLKYFRSVNYFVY